MDQLTRLITFLNCSTNNRAATVAESFTRAVRIYGISKHVCSDHGGENVEVWRFCINHVLYIPLCCVLYCVVIIIIVRLL